MKEENHVGEIGSCLQEMYRNVVISKKISVSIEIECDLMILF